MSGREECALVTELIFARFKNAFLPECCMLASQQRALLYSLRQLLQPAVSTPSLNLPVLSPWVQSSEGLGENRRAAASIGGDSWGKDAVLLSHSTHFLTTGRSLAAWAGNCLKHLHFKMWGWVPDSLPTLVESFPVILSRKGEQAPTWEKTDVQVFTSQWSYMEVPSCKTKLWLNQLSTLWKIIFA